MYVCYMYTYLMHLKYCQQTCFKKGIIPVSQTPTPECLMSIERNSVQNVYQCCISCILILSCLVLYVSAVRVDGSVMNQASGSKVSQDGNSKYRVHRTHPVYFVPARNPGLQVLPFYLGLFTSVRFQHVKFTAT
uniref:Uncharacterized protein n=1 Tax=Cacopsylla melanoneura TaxID=428564 RepID=A0A8D9EP31_9HEMI